MTQKRKHLPIAGIAVLVLAATAAMPAGAIETIDCKKDFRPAERTICASQRLQILDATVTQAYADVMYDAVVPQRTKNRVQWGQRAFLGDRDRCGSDARCLEQTMQWRLDQLRKTVF